MIKMKNVFLISILLVLAGCAATRAATEALEKETNDVRAGRIQLEEAYARGATDTELTAIEDQLKQDVKELKQAALNLKDAVKEDAQGFLGLTANTATGGVASLGITALAWWMRDRRKKLGKDPLQLSGVKTPPTSV